MYTTAAVSAVYILLVVISFYISYYFISLSVMLNVFHCYTNHLLFYASILVLMYTIGLLLVLTRALLFYSFLSIPQMFYVICI